MKKGIITLALVAIATTSAVAAQQPIKGSGGMWPSAAAAVKANFGDLYTSVGALEANFGGLSASVGALEGTVDLTQVSNAAGPVDIPAASALAGVSILNTNDDTTVFNLPPAAAGMKVCVRNAQGVSKIIQVNPDDADYVVLPTGARASAAGDHYAATAAGGNAVCLEAYDGTDWYVVSSRGTWAEE